MIVFNWKKNGTNKNLIYYHNGEEIVKSDVDSYLESFIKPQKKYEINRTLFTDLTLNEEEIFEKIDKNWKYKIRRCENKDDVTI